MPQRGHCLGMLSLGTTKKRSFPFWRCGDATLIVPGWSYEQRKFIKSPNLPEGGNEQNFETCIHVFSPLLSMCTSSFQFLSSLSLCNERQNTEKKSLCYTEHQSNPWHKQEQKLFQFMPVVFYSWVHWAVRGCLMETTLDVSHVWIRIGTGTAVMVCFSGGNPLLVV